MPLRRETNGLYAATTATTRYLPAATCERVCHHRHLLRGISFLVGSLMPVSGRVAVTGTDTLRFVSGVRISGVHVVIT
ncbi:hypothetical protein AN480_29385 [Mycobacterium intracellulare subsp. chimaera]|nr:hypothetical protein AN480_29385 [Mycobacterium intracellulare subsp. chimaera]